MKGFNLLMSAAVCGCKNFNLSQSESCWKPVLSHFLFPTMLQDQCMGIVYLLSCYPDSVKQQISMKFNYDKESILTGSWPSCAPEGCVSQNHVGPCQNIRFLFHI